MIAQRCPRAAGWFAVLLVALGGCATQPEMSAVRASAGERAPSRAEQPAVGDRAVTVALDQLGVPYRYGGAGPGGFDCSGLVHFAYARAGKAVPRTTGELWRRTAPVDAADARPGDVLFFRFDGKMSHVGLYIGDGRFVHAPSSGRHVAVERLDSEPYRTAFIRAARPY
ncbi:MAG: C40 family peptidase [Woeseiaceae bacterium]|nr:C40 family peptidase [Woeseiaceae bacterium]